MRLTIQSIMGRKGAFFQVGRTFNSEFAQRAPEVSKTLGPVQARLQVTNTGDGYLVTGDLSLEVEFFCSRCLKPYQTTLTPSVEEEFFNRPQEDDELNWDGELLVEGHEIDLASLIEESILVSIPMKPVCQEDCPGLCPGCGRFLGDGICDCTDPDIDIRLAPLGKLLQQASETTAPERRKAHDRPKEKTLQSED